jgi:hypothetical protein
MSTSPNWLFMVLIGLGIAAVVGAVVHFTSKE